MSQIEPTTATPPIAIPEGVSRLSWFPLAAAVLFVGLFWPLGQQLISLWSIDSNYSHGFLVLPLSLWLGWRAVRDHPLPEQSHEVAIGSTTLILGLFIHLTGVVLRWLPLELVALLMVLRGAALIVGGREWANRLLFPMFFLVFLFPLPATLTTNIAIWLQDWVAWLSTEILGMVYACFRRGNHIHIAGMAEPIYVAQECSGIRQVMAFVALGALFAYVANVGLARGALLVALAIPVALVANVARVVLMSAAMYHFGTNWASTWMHDIPAMVTLPLGVALFFGMVWLVTPAPPKAIP